MPRIVNHILVKDFLADGAITAKRIVGAGTNDEDVAQIRTANDEPLGVALATVADNETVDIVMFGPAICTAAGAISRGALVAADANGKVTAITVGTTTADVRVVGYALEAASTDGDDISIFIGLNPFVVV